MSPHLIFFEVLYMHKVMVFIDYQNFNINLKEHFKNKDKELRSINYKKLGNAINELIPFNSEVIKTFIFAYKPNDKLMSLESNKKYYEWLTEKLKKTKYLEVIEGRQEIRYYKDTKFDINNPDTYTTVEKETDINLATHMVAKGFQNAYDIAVLVSGDTDYTSVIQTLHNIGKIIVIAHFKHQNISKYDGIYDAEVILYDDILEKSLNQKSKNNTEENVNDKDKEQD